MSCTALILADDPAYERTLATLTVLDRLVISAHKAGLDKIKIIHTGNPPKLTRTQALGIKVQLLDQMPPFKEPTLLLAGNLTVQENDLIQVIRKRGRLYNLNREALPCGITAEWKTNLDTSLPDLPKIETQGTAKVVKDGLTAIQAEDILWDSVGLETDSFLDQNFNRPIGRFASKILIHTPISPNAISVVGTLVGILSAWCFTRGEAPLMVLGALLLQASAIVDCVDGDVARILHKETHAGKWLDLGGGQLVHLCLIVGMAMGLHRLNDPSGPYLWLGLVAALGVVLSFLAILRAKQSKNHLPRLNSFIARNANRDFSALLLVLAIVERVHWFFGVAVLAVNGFWIYGAWLHRIDEMEEAA